jgi:microsomal epoxide hydrolase
MHSNWVMANEPASHPVSSLTKLEQLGIQRGKEFVERGIGYSMEHATKPSTLGFVLGSNPLALLAWIGEKFLAWSDVNPELDVILESVTLYWFTESGGRALYPYRQVSISFQFATRYTGVFSMF